jgi:Ca2+-binding EF-hand superfamily protein
MKMSDKLLSLIASLLKTSAQCEQRVENRRLNIASLRDFEPTSTYQLLDQGNKGYINAQDLIVLFKGQSPPCDLQEMEALVSSQMNSYNQMTLYSGGGYYLRSSLGMSLEAFKLLVLPRTKNYSLEAGLVCRPKQRTLNSRVRLYLAWLIEEELQFRREVEERIGALGEPIAFESYKCFAAIAKSGLNRYYMQLFLEQYSCSLTKAGMDALFNRWDLDRDCRLSYREFLAATKPSLTSTASDPQISLKYGSALHSSPLKTGASSIKFSTPDNKTQAREANTGSTAHSMTESPDRNILGSLKSPPKTALASSRKLDFEAYTPVTETDRVLSVFSQDIDIDVELDSKIRQLALLMDFNLADLYRFFNRHADDGLTIPDFEAAAQELKVKVDRKLIVQLMQKYDADEDGRLKATDLFAMFSSKDNYHKHLLLRRPSNSRRLFSNETLSSIAEALQLHFECLVKAEKLRQELKREKIDLYSVFNALDLDRDGYLSQSDLSKSLRTHGLTVTLGDLEFLTARYDSNHDGRISYVDFVEELTPKSH